ncbi:response regulator [Spirosoma agri]|uniref:Response regulator n=1 Tax=Spirosoma agri TaxID=1987381 RepID=A0A6M0IJJ9_9BACT|nr:response regulator [Spirosoma agri]NEU68017.1 response regulator [Spirosoma agri]
MSRRLTNFRLLVVDDQEDQATLTQGAFLQIIPTAQVVRVTNGDEAIRFLASCTDQEWDFPQLILLDLYMPHREEGWQILNAIRALPAPLNQVPVIIFSSSTHEDDIQMAYQLGCTSYMVKPMTYEEWLDYFKALKTYWLDTATLPRMSYTM